MTFYYLYVYIYVCVFVQSTIYFIFLGTVDELDADEYAKLLYFPLVLLLYAQTRLFTIISEFIIALQAQCVDMEIVIAVIFGKVIKRNATLPVIIYPTGYLLPSHIPQT